MSPVENASPAEAQAAAALTAKQNGSGPLSFKEKLGYGLGDTASHFVWDMVGF